MTAIALSNALDVSLRPFSEAQAGIDFPVLGAIST